MWIQVIRISMLPTTPLMRQHWVVALRIAIKTGIRWLVHLAVWERIRGPLIERQGKYLASKPSLTIRVEGNADERGGREYNLALGQKRADAVVRALKVYGVGDKQLEAVSFGSEKPFAQGHDESAWAQNRRVDLAYPNK